MKLLLLFPLLFTGLFCFANTEDCDEFKLQELENRFLCEESKQIAACAPTMFYGASLAGWSALMWPEQKSVPTKSGQKKMIELFRNVRKEILPLQKELREFYQDYLKAYETAKKKSPGKIGFVTSEPLPITPDHLNLVKNHFKPRSASNSFSQDFLKGKLPNAYSNGPFDRKMEAVFKNMFGEAPSGRDDFKTFHGNRDMLEFYKSTISHQNLAFIRTVASRRGLYRSNPDLDRALVDDYRKNAAQRLALARKGRQPMGLKSVYSNMDSFDRMLNGVPEPKASTGRLNANGVRVAAAGLSSAAAWASMAAPVYVAAGALSGCAEELKISLTSDETKELSSGFYSLSPAMDRARSCNELYFKSGTISDLRNRDKLTPAMEQFFCKLEDSFAKRQIQLLEKENSVKINSQCDGFTFNEMKVKWVEDRLEIEGPSKIKTAISKNSVGEWDYASLTSPDVGFKTNYLLPNYLSLMPKSESRVLVQKAQLDLNSACSPKKQGVYDKAFCEVAQAINVVSLTDPFQKALCVEPEQKADPIASDSDQGSNTGTVKKNQ